MTSFRVIRTSGVEENHLAPRAQLIDAVKRALACEVFDTVNLREGCVMIVDDDGWSTAIIHHENGVEAVPTTPKLPLIAKATAICKSVTLPNEHQIAGDVAIVRDEEFA